MAGLLPYILQALAALTSPAGSNMPDTESKTEEDLRNDPRRKRLLFRSQHRGMKEADILLGGYVARNLGTMSDQDVSDIEKLFDEVDNDLVAWIMGKEPVPADNRSPVLDQMIAENKEPGH